MTKTQLAFIEGRQIIDVILMVAEIVDEYLSNKKKGYIIKLDFEKAYDRDDWGFLEAVMEQKGFITRWRKKIQGCLSIANFSIMIKDRPRGKFMLREG
jgi:hypothetical protein